MRSCVQSSVMRCVRTYFSVVLSEHPADVRLKPIANNDNKSAMYVCAHVDTHLARYHAHMHARCDEGAHVCVMPFNHLRTSCTHVQTRRNTQRPRLLLGELGIGFVSHDVSTCASRLTRTLAFLRRPAQAD